MIQVTGLERDTVKMRAVQLPFVVNNATTGHKLQGTGLDQLFVHSWSYVTNWVYVMLSRVKRKTGLFCRKALSYDLSKYKVPVAYTHLISIHLAEKLPTFWSDDEYNELFEYST